MGVLQDQITAIRNNGALSDDEKRRQIYAVKCNGLLAHMNVAGRYLGKPFTFNGITVTVWAVGVTIEDPKRLVIDMERTRLSDGYNERVDHYIVNPPILDSTKTENLAQVVPEMLTSFPFGA